MYLLYLRIPQLYTTCALVCGSVSKSTVLLINIIYKRQTDLDVHYKDVVFERRFRIDLLVDNKVLVENKAIKSTTNQDEAQLINYLKTTHLRVGLLFNFGADKFEMKRRIL